MEDGENRISFIKNVKITHEKTEKSDLGLLSWQDGRFSKSP